MKRLCLHALLLGSFLLLGSCYRCYSVGCRPPWDQAGVNAAVNSSTSLILLDDRQTVCTNLWNFVQRTNSHSNDGSGKAACVVKWLPEGQTNSL